MGGLLPALLAAEMELFLMTQGHARPRRQNAKAYYSAMGLRLKSTRRTCAALSVLKQKMAVAAVPPGQALSSETETFVHYTFS
jgi:hypothetical protein